MFDFITMFGVYGGMFAIALVGSTIFVPFSVEATILILEGFQTNPYLIVISASLGAVVGTWVNYGLGFFSAELIEKKVGKDNLDKAKNVMDRYGWAGLFAVIAIPVPIPIPVDPLTVIPGLTKMSFREFTTVVLAAKLLRYAIVVGLVNGLFYIAGL